MLFEPYVPAVTPVLAIEIVPVLVIVPPDKPVPAVMDVTVPDPYPCALTKAVVAIVMLSSLETGVGARGLPVNKGDASGAAPKRVMV